MVDEAAREEPKVNHVAVEVLSSPILCRPQLEWRNLWGFVVSRIAVGQVLRPGLVEGSSSLICNLAGDGSEMLLTNAV